MENCNSSLCWERTKWQWIGWVMVVARGYRGSVKTKIVCEVLSSSTIKQKQSALHGGIQEVKIFH